MPATPENFADAFLLTGPTGSGKSALALDLAEAISAEIIAADSMTLYRGLDIGTAKPSEAELARVPHHLIDVLDPSESANVAWWLDRAAEACLAIRSRGKRPLFVGGTPFYLKALMYGLFEGPPVDTALRSRLEAEAERDGKLAMHARLTAADPVSAARLHVNDVRRVIRALEVFEQTGQPLSALQQTWDNPSFGNNAGPKSLPGIVLEWPREELYSRIDRRVEAMMASGWLEEVRGLANVRLGPEASQALGYHELAEVLASKRTLADAVAEIQLRTRQFAKRQLTWFRRLPNLTTLSAQDPQLLENAVKLTSPL
ncbi:MAG: tRNA (adenosine(37)-N6)-dimethylallyltransferase MiaA [Fimbriiglobus sp.]